MKKYLGKARENKRPDGIPAAHFWPAALFIVFVFLTGGGSRADILSLTLLRPVCAAVLTAILVLRWRQLGEVRTPLIAIALVAVFLLLQLVPLPPEIWRAMNGREIIVQIDTAASIADAWRPLAVDSHAAWNTIFSLLVPAASLAVIGAAGPEVDDRIVRLLLGLVFTAAVLGLFQLLAGSQSSLYLYRITSDDSAVGLMANRNHHALFLASGMPLLAYWMSCLKGDRAQVMPMQVAGAFLMMMLVPFIVMTGSRGGLVLALLGFVGALLVYRKPQILERRQSSRWSAIDFRYIWLALGTVAAALSYFAGRLTSFDRLTIGVGAEADRLSMLPTVLQIAQDFFPFGSGAGSFVPVFKVYETDALLQPYYYNHAHNDYLEILIEHGLAGAIFVLIGLGIMLYATVRLWIAWRKCAAPGSARLSLGTAGMVILIMCAASSLFDYPLRVPSIQLLACIAALWVSRTLFGRNLTS